MNKHNAKLFICHHPSGLPMYKNFIQIIREYAPQTRVILFKVDHPFFSKFNFAAYKDCFDEIIEFGFITYKRNFFSGFLDIFNFQRKLNRVIKTWLNQFERVDIFLDDSAWLPVNILLYNLSRATNVGRITKFSGMRLENMRNIKISRIKSFLANLYTLPFRRYKIKVVTTLQGRVLDYSYTGATPGISLKIISPDRNKDSEDQDNAIPYPVILPRPSLATKKDTVVIFGSIFIYPIYPEYLFDYGLFINKLSALLRGIENKYTGYKLYYKPHPSDKEIVMPEIDLSNFSLLNEAVTAEEMLNINHQNIRAVYTFCSTSAMYGSFFGIPAYTFYRYLCNKSGIEKFDSLFKQVDSRLLFHLAALGEIGKIDALGSDAPGGVDLKNLDCRYRKILNIS